MPQSVLMCSLVAVIAGGMLLEGDTLPEGGLLAWAHGQACEFRSGGTGSMARPPDTFQAARRRSSSPHLFAAAVRSSCPAIMIETSVVI